MRLGPEGPWDENQKKEAGSDASYHKYTSKEIDKAKDQCDPVYSYLEYYENRILTVYNRVDD